MLLDILVVIFLAFSVAMGFRKGFIKTLFSFGGTAASLILALILSGPVTNYARETRYFTGMESALQTRIEGAINPGGPSSPEAAVPKALGVIINGIKGARDAAATSTAATLSQIISRSVLSVFVGVGLFILFKLLFILLGAALGAVFKLPVLNFINRMGGLLAGALNGMIIIMVFFSVLTFFVGSALGVWVSAQLDESSVAKIIYDNNFILRLML